MQTLILNHYPPVIKNIKDMQQIAKSEDIEFAKLNTSIKEVLSNMFVSRADENGVKRFEKLLKITPKAMQSLNDRKMYIIAIMNQRKMSLSELTVMLSNYCEDIKLIHNMLDMEMTVETGENTVGINTINKILEEILPVNIYYHFLTKIERNATNKIVIEPQIGAKIKINPLLKKEITLETRKIINTHLKSLESISVNPLLAEDIRLSVKKEIKLIIYRKESIVINPLLKKEVKVETKATITPHIYG